MANISVVIPAYNEASTIRNVAERVLLFCEHLIVVDDGSTDSTCIELQGLPVTVLRNDTNQGKAASLWRGIQSALEKNADAIITLDGDGQHRPEDIPGFIQSWETHPRHMIIGSRLADTKAFPRNRLIANKIANFWISWAAGHSVADSQCGYRLYPAALLEKVTPDISRSQSFVFESAMIIHAAKAGYETQPVPIEAIYDPHARTSHFRGVRDITLIVRMVAWSLISRGFYPQGLIKSLPDRRGIIDSDGLAMLTLSNMVIIGTLGLSYWLVFFKTRRIARYPHSLPECNHWLLVPGMKLNKDIIPPDYQRRLDKARDLMESNADISLLILGGLTGDKALSEAEAGKQYLIGQGIAGSRIHSEEQSKNTLENLRRARDFINHKKVSSTLITNRYHLARCHALANGLKLEHKLFPAEDIISLNIFKLLKEAYLLHWYEVGKRWVTLTGNTRMLNRIQ